MISVRLPPTFMVETPSSQPAITLRWPIGKDAIGFCTGRPKISDEEWVAMGGGLTDEEYNARFKRYFGIDL